MGAIYVSLVSLALGQRPVHGTIAFGEVSNATHFTSNWMLDKVLLTNHPAAARAWGLSVLGPYQRGKGCVVLGGVG
jgi:hypothetical protein